VNGHRILFSSLSGKTALLKEVLSDARSYSPNTVILGADCDKNCAGASQVETFIQMPRLVELSDHDLLQFCIENKITHILPTRDGELLFWAKRKSILRMIGVTPLVSEPGFIEACEDKTAFFLNWKNSVIPPIPTYNNLKSSGIKNWVVKERTGSGSRNIGLNLSFKKAKQFSKKLSNPIFQPFIDGKEYTAETWVSKSNHCRGVLLRWRKEVVNGESHLTKVFNNPDWESKMKRVFEYIPGARGHCVAQVLVDLKGNQHLIEINPRLGGASPLAIHAGLHSIKWHLMEEDNKLNDLMPHPTFPSGMYLRKQNGKVLFGP
jgi:carbamoyl-phosphate synthase large subunit